MPRSIKGVCAPIDRRLIVNRSRSTISKRERANTTCLCSEEFSSQALSANKPRELLLCYSAYGNRRLDRGVTKWERFFLRRLPPEDSALWAAIAILSSSSSTRGFSSPGNQGGIYTYPVIIYCH